MNKTNAGHINLGSLLRQIKEACGALGPEVKY